MILTTKDKDFLAKLSDLVDSKDLWIELKPGEPSRMILKGTYGQEINKVFRMTRQGVRWRFQRLFGQVYVQAFLAILMIEKTFGSQLREYAVRISQEQYALYNQSLSSSFKSADTFIRTSCQDNDPSREP